MTQRIYNATGVNMANHNPPLIAYIGFLLVLCAAGLSLGYAFWISYGRWFFLGRRTLSEWWRDSKAELRQEVGARPQHRETQPPSMSSHGGDVLEFRRR